MRDDRQGGHIRWRMHIPTPPARVFEVLNSNEGRASFWASSAIESEGTIEFRFINGFTCTCSLLRRDKPHLWVIDYIAGPARFDLAPDGSGGTDLLLTQTGVDSGHWNEVHAGWLKVLFPLKAWVAYGIDLRNHDPERSWERGYADQ